MSTLTYLVGPPASGKRTIGQELSVLTGAALIDNHLVNDPIFTAYGADGRTPLPQWIWTQVEQVRDATFTALVHAAPHVSHILTNYLISSDPYEEQFLQRMRALADERGAHFLPVWLTCPEDELVRRVALPDRRQRQKMNDPELLRRTLRQHGVLHPSEDALVLDTSTLPPGEAVKRIATWSNATSIIGD